jgi:hypothetical protein
MRNSVHNLSQNIWLAGLQEVIPGFLGWHDCVVVMLKHDLELLRSV